MAEENLTRKIIILIARGLRRKMLDAFDESSISTKYGKRIIDYDDALKIIDRELNFFIEGVSQDLDNMEKFNVK